LDFVSIEKCIKEHPEAIALHVREDLLLLLSVMAVKEELLLDKFDKVRIYRGDNNRWYLLLTSIAVDILRIQFPNKCGRSAILEMTEYRRRVVSILAHRNYTPL
jgi:hypothetical protein